MARRRYPGREPYFYLFSSLPPELRLNIWSLNLPTSRIVTIRCGPRTVSSGFHGSSHDDQLVRCTSPTPIPMNLQVCHESRAEALKQYQVLFGVGGQPGKIYFDPTRDILYFGVRDDGFAGSEAHMNAFMSMISLHDRSLIKHVAVNEALIRDGALRLNNNNSNNDPPNNSAVPRMAAEEKLVCQIRARLRNLKHLTFVCGDSNPVYSPDSIFVSPDQKNRLVERRIRDAIQKIKAKYPRFTPPEWDRRAIAAEPNRPIYDQRVLGYSGPRLSFFCPASRKAWTAFQCACNYCGREGDLSLCKPQTNSPEGGEALPIPKLDLVSASMLVAGDATICEGVFGRGRAVIAFLAAVRVSDMLKLLATVGIQDISRNLGAIGMVYVVEFMIVTGLLAVVGKSQGFAL